jgi:murein DD-endopeptidase MepM/ murein hydrolase activator NlpD
LLGDSGTDYYYTHLDKRFAAEGTKVQVGDVIATIANYDLFGRASHVHLGAKPGPSGHPDWQDIRNSPAVN